LPVVRPAARPQAATRRLAAGLALAAGLLLAAGAAAAGERPRPAAAGRGGPVAPALPDGAPADPQVLSLQLAQVYADAFGLPLLDLERLVRAGFPDPDVAVIALASSAGATPLNNLALMRRNKASWREILREARVPARALLPVTTLRRPPARYAGALARLAANPDGAPSLGDAEIADLVFLKIAAEHFGMAPATVAASRNRGASGPRILLGQHRANNGQPTGRRVLMRK
jgi:hypothetical protein